MSITVVWFLIFAVAVFGLIVAPIGILQSSLAGASLSESTAFEGEDGAIGILIMVVIVPPLLGTATIAIVSASTGFVLASATLFARSLRADYRDEQLSFTVQSSSGDTMRPQGGTSVAMSLLLALVAVAVWWRRSHIATVMPKSFRKSVYEYSWPNTAPERG